MKLIILSLISIFSLYSFSSELPKFKDLSKTIQEDLLNELRAEPIFIKNTSAETGVDGTYLGLIKKNDETYIFDAFIWYGTQGADGVAIKNLEPIEDRYDSKQMKPETIKIEGRSRSGDCSVKIQIGRYGLDQVSFSVKIGGSIEGRVSTETIADFYKKLQEKRAPLFDFPVYEYTHTKYIRLFFKQKTNPLDLDLEKFQWGMYGSRYTPIECRF